ncbi:CheR family methyltransferase [Deferrisoma sp.]
MAEPQPIPPLRPGAYRAIAELVYRHTGIRLGPGKEYFARARFGGLLRDLGCADWDEFVPAVTQRGRRVVEALIQAVVTPETSFFRDRAPFEALRNAIVPAFAQGKPLPFRLRVWSAGCSHGQEPYSVVMCLWDLLETGRIVLDLLATDLSPRALERARRAEYDDWELARGLDAAARARYFDPLPDGRARVKENVRRRVRFRRHNLVAEPPPDTGFHVVLCRNVGIYFGRETKAKLYRCLASALAPGGVLILGGAETLLSGLEGFRPEYHGRALVYRKTVEDGP